MSETLILTAVKPDQVKGLRRYLNELPRDAEPADPDQPRQAPRSPFSGAVPPTHFARLVVIELEDRHHLLFSGRFDGPVAEYLRALAATETALAIWGHCDLSTALDHRALDPDVLAEYLCDPRHRLPAQYVVSAFPAEVTVAEINAALALRTQVSGFAARAPVLDQSALAHEFRQLPAIRRLLSGHPRGCR
jgi:hypothetical protein